MRFRSRICLDALDYAIYRHLSPDGLVRFWGGRRLVDPRVSAREIADKVGLSEAGVRSRLRSLKQRGYLRSTEMWLNPSLFDVSIVVAEVPIKDPGEAKRLCDELALIEGVTFARDILDEEDRKVRVYYISDTPAATARRTALLRRLAPSAQIRGPTPYWIPPCSRLPSPLDWRLLGAFRRRPDSTLARFASDVRVSLKTTASRFHQLLDSGTCWWTISHDSEEMPLALLSLRLDAQVDPPNVGQSAAREIPGWIPLAPDGMGIAPSEGAPWVAGLVPVDSPVTVEHLVRRALTVDGVRSVRRTFALGSTTYPQWFDERIAGRLSGRS